MAGKQDQGFTLIEVLIVVAIISVNAAIAVPGLQLAQTTANEASAIASLKLTTSAQVAYSVACGNGGYAASFVVLGTPPPGGEPFVPADLGKVVAPRKSGYFFTLGPGAGAAAGPNDCNGRATITRYLATGIPTTNGTTGTRSFAVNAGNTIWQLAGGVAPREPFGAPAVPIQ